MDKSEASPERNQAPPSSYQPSASSRPSEQNPTWRIPRLLIFKPLPAWNSSQIDERCFIYCSQTSRDRAWGQDPWCRAICFRRVYGHEVHDGSYDATQDINSHLKPSEALPLPPEGQPSEVVPNGYVENNEKTKYWREGRYVWVSKSRWAAQEKLDSMNLNLSGQTAWMRYKEHMEKQRLAEEMGHEEYIGPRHHAPDVDHDESIFPPPDSVRFSPSIAIRDSLLFPITPLSTVIRETLHDRLSFILGPTYKVLTVLGLSFTEGTQSRFFEKAYQQATNGSTLTLLRNAWSKHESWWKEGEERKEVEERKKKGGGGEVGEGGGVL